MVSGDKGGSEMIKQTTLTLGSNEQRVSEDIPCPQCGKVCPNQTYCVNCGRIHDPKLLALMGKLGLKETVKDE